MQDLLLLPPQSAAALVLQDAQLRTDPNPGGAIFERYGQLRVDDNLWRDYRATAEAMAQAVTLDDALIRAIAPMLEGGDQGQTQRRDRFLRDQGLRAHRRPLGDDELTRYADLFELGPTFFPEQAASTGGVFSTGMRAVIEAWLQAPYFLYRPEIAVADNGEAQVALDDYEMASRLSFALWGSMPDAELFAAASAGELSTRDEVAAAAERMIMDPRAGSEVEAMHSQLFEVERYPFIVAPVAAGLSSSFGESLAVEHRLFVRDVFDRDGGLRALLTSKQTFVNAELAALYGVTRVGERDLEDEDEDEVFQRVELDPNERGGILTMLGFLAKNASGGAPDPIRRGAFISTRLACNVVPPPPDGIPSLPIVDGETNREAIEQLTEQEGSSCIGCHASLINPFGFPFEGYGAVGSRRSEDNGFPINDQSLLWIDGEETSIEGPLALVELLADSQAVHRCYAGHWLDFTLGRGRSGDDDRALLDVLAAASLDEGQSLRALLVATVSSDTFRFRPAERSP